MSNLKKRKVTFDGEIMTKKQKVPATIKGKIQKYSSSSGSESEDPIPKKKIIQKTLQIRRKISKKKSSDSSTCLKEKNLSEGKESLKENGGKYLANNHSPDSDEPPLVIDESASNGLQKQMKNEMELKKSSPVKTNTNNTTSDSESEIEGTQEIVKKINYNNYMKSKRNMCKNLHTSESESDSNEVEETIKTQSFNTNKSIKTKEVSETSKATTPESELDSNEVEETIKTQSFNTSKSIKTKEVIETSKATTSESESDVEASQETTSNHRNVITTRAIINKRPIVSSSESDSDSSKTLTQQKTNNSENNKKVEDSKTGSLKGSNTPISESESDTNETEKLAKTNNHDEDTNNVNKSNIEPEIFSKSESDSEEKQDNESTEDFGRRQKTSEDVESNKGETKETENKSDEVDSTVDKNEETNLDVAETRSVKIEDLGNLENPCDMPTLNYDLVMMEEIKEKNNSEESDFELTLENGSSHGEKEPASSDTGQSQVSNNKIRKRKLLGKKRLNSPKKASPPVAEVEREMDNIVPENKQDQVSSDDSADEEDLNETPVSFRQSSYQPTKEERSKLANMTVNIGYTVLRQHEVESTAGTRTMNEREREDFETITGFPIKRGKFDSSEDKILKKNWKVFCQTHDWDPKNPKPFLFMKHKNKEFLLSQVNRKRFMQRLACGLPNRSLYSIFQRFKNLFEPHRTCRYSEDEDRVIVDFISKYNNIDQKDRKFAELATILRRTRASVWRRCRVLNKKQMLSDDSFCHSSK